MDENTNAYPQAADFDLKTAQISQEKAIELQQLVAEQLNAVSPQEAAQVTLTEMLADDNGALGQKVQELGLAREWEEFKAAQQPIGQLREQIIALAEEAQAAAAAKEQQPETTKKQGKINLTGALVGAIVAGQIGKGKVESNPIRAVIAAAGAFFGAAVASIIGAKRNQTPQVDPLAEQAELEQMAAQQQRLMELQQQIGLAQERSMEGLVDAAVERMTELELAAQQLADVQPEVAPAQEAAPQMQAPQEQAPQEQEPLFVPEMETGEAMHPELRDSFELQDAEPAKPAAPKASEVNVEEPSQELKAIFDQLAAEQGITSPAQDKPAAESEQSLEDVFNEIYAEQAHGGEVKGGHAEALKREREANQQGAAQAR